MSDFALVIKSSAGQAFLGDKFTFVTKNKEPDSIETEIYEKGELVGVASAPIYRIGTNDAIVLPEDGKFLQRYLSEERFKELGLSPDEVLNLIYATGFYEDLELTRERGVTSVLQLRYLAEFDEDGLPIFDWATLATAD